MTELFPDNESADLKGFSIRWNAEFHLIEISKPNLAFLNYDYSNRVWISFDHNNL